MGLAHCFMYRRSLLGTTPWLLARSSSFVFFLISVLVATGVPRSAAADQATTFNTKASRRHLAQHEGPAHSTPPLTTSSTVTTTTTVTTMPPFTTMTAFSAGACQQDGYMLCEVEVGPYKVKGGSDYDDCIFTATDTNMILNISMSKCPPTRTMTAEVVVDTYELIPIRGALPLQDTSRNSIICNCQSSRVNTATNAWEIATLAPEITNNSRGFDLHFHMCSDETCQAIIEAPPPGAEIFHFQIKSNDVWDELEILRLLACKSAGAEDPESLCEPLVVDKCVVNPWLDVRISPAGNKVMVSMLSFKLWGEAMLTLFVEARRCDGSEACGACGVFTSSSSTSTSTSSWTTTSSSTSTLSTTTVTTESSTTSLSSTSSTPFVYASLFQKADFHGWYSGASLGYREGAVSFEDCARLCVETYRCRGLQWRYVHGVRNRCEIKSVTFTGAVTGGYWGAFPRLWGVQYGYQYSRKGYRRLNTYSSPATERELQLDSGSAGSDDITPQRQNQSRIALHASGDEAVVMVSFNRREPAALADSITNKDDSAIISFMLPPGAEQAVPGTAVADAVMVSTRSSSGQEVHVVEMVVVTMHFAQQQQLRTGANILQSSSNNLFVVSLRMRSAVDADGADAASALAFDAEAFEKMVMDLGVAVVQGTAAVDFHRRAPGFERTPGSGRFGDSGQAPTTTDENASKGDGAEDPSAEGESFNLEDGVLMVLGCGIAGFLACTCLACCCVAGLMLHVVRKGRSMPVADLNQLADLAQLPPLPLETVGTSKQNALRTSMQLGIGLGPGGPGERLRTSADASGGCSIEGP